MSVEVLTGVDGCRAGWLWISRDLETGSITCGVAPDADALLEAEPVILDTFACLRTAERVHRGDAVSLPENPPRDAHGLAMVIVY